MMHASADHRAILTTLKRTLAYVALNLRPLFSGLPDSDVRACCAMRQVYMMATWVDIIFSSEALHKQQRALNLNFFRVRPEYVL
eukprot:5382489-Amphidinium_carterae.1